MPRRQPRQFKAAIRVRHGLNAQRPIQLSLPRILSQNAHRSGFTGNFMPSIATLPRARIAGGNTIRTGLSKVTRHRHDHAAQTSSRYRHHRHMPRRIYPAGSNSGSPDRDSMPPKCPESCPGCRRPHIAPSDKGSEAYSTIPARRPRAFSHPPEKPPGYSAHPGPETACRTHRS